MSDAAVRVLGRYALHGEIAAGGMATVHLGRLLGPVGFCRTVAIKRLHPQFAKDPDFVSMFLDEARLAARIQHPNVVSTLDVVARDGELFLVMEYVEGESLARLIRGMCARGQRLPPKIVASIATGMLYGLHAAHEAKTEQGQPLKIIHRDVSPQNVLVGLDGVARVLDFGVAKAVGRAQTTREGQIKGKLSYMPPEQILGEEVDRRVDVYSAGVVVWESLLGKRLFDGENEGNILKKILSGDVLPPSRVAPEVPPAFDAIVLRALSTDPARRFATAWEFAVALEEVAGLESPRRIGEFVRSCAGEAIERRLLRVRQLESMTTEAEGGGPGVADAGALRPSDPSVVASATRISRREPASSRAILAILAILGLGALAALGIIVLKRDRWARVASDVPSTSGAPIPGSPASTEAPPRTTGSAVAREAAKSEPEVPTSPLAPPNASASASPSNAAPHTPIVRTARPTAPPPPPPPPQVPANDPCKSPTYYENGIKKIKPQCVPR